MPLSVEARGSVDTSKKGSLGLTYRYQDTLLPGVNVHLYRIADISSAGEFTLISPYDQFTVTDLNKISDQSEWDNLLNPVAAYIYTNNVTPDAEAVSDAYFNALERLGMNEKMDAKNFSFEDFKKILAVFNPFGTDFIIKFEQINLLKH